MRQLASVQKITALNPIEGADAIEVADILGWHVVVKKGEFQVGDLCVYVEIDSVLPKTPWSEFLADKNRPEKPIRVKTIRLRGQISQGIAFPLTILPYDVDTSSVFPAYVYKEGEEVTELLGIIKYEPPESNEGGMGTVSRRGNFPIDIPKTDETRIQSCHKYLEQFVEETRIRYFINTEKADGSSITFYLKDDEFGVCSRNLNLKDTEDNLFWQTARKYDIEAKMRSLGMDNIAIQGEMCGPRICGNKLGLNELKLFVYNFYSIKDANYATPLDLMLMIERLGLESVPILDDKFDILDSSGKVKSVDELVAYATRKSVINPDVWAEGVVFRPEYSVRHPKMGRVSFKAINPEFELKYKNK